MNHAITAALAARIASGMDVRTAWDDVFGAGAYERMAGDLHDALRAAA
jgi:hypothetical protein